MECIDYSQEYIEQAIRIWNEVVLEGQAFPQKDCLDKNSGHAFFMEQTKTRLAVCDNQVVGISILHPNNVGRCGHIANASYAVDARFQGKGIGKCLVQDSLKQAKSCGFQILQFNAVVADNIPALNVYKKLGFTQLGVIPKGYKNKEGIYKDIIPHYISL